MVLYFVVVGDALAPLGEVTEGRTVSKPQGASVIGAPHEFRVTHVLPLKGGDRWDCRA